MSVVGTFSGTGSATSPSLQVGDLVVVVAGSPSSTLGTPSGFTRVGQLTQMTMFPSGGQGMARTWNGIYWRRVTGAGAVTVAPVNSSRIIGVALRGPTALAAANADLRNAQPFDYPFVLLDAPMTGHVVHVGIHANNQGWQVPAGDTTVDTAYVEGYGARNFSGSPITMYSRLSVGQHPITATATVPATVGGTRVFGTAFTLVFADVAGPAAPTITAPDAGSIDMNAGFTFSWEPSWAQTGFVLRRSQAGWPPAYWTGTDWSGTTETVVPGSVTSVVTPPGQITNDGNPWLFEVATVGDQYRPELGSYASRTLKPVTAPNPPGISLSHTSGGVLSSFTPTITLSGGAGSGATMNGYIVKLWQGGTMLHEQPIISPSPGFAWNVPASIGRLIGNRADLTVTARVAQDSGQRGPEASVTVYVDVPTPPAPMVTTEPVSHPVSGAPGTLVTVTPGSPMAAGVLQVWRVVDGDRVRIWSGDVGDGWTVEDYLAPSIDPHTYEAAVTTDDPIPVTSPAGSSALITLPHACGWVIDPLHIETAVRTSVVDIGERTTDLRTYASVPLGQSGWVVHSDVAVDETGTLTLSVEGDDQLAALRALITSGARLFIRGWLEKGVWHKDARGNALDLWVRLVGQTGRSHVAPGPFSLYDIPVSYVAVDPPEWE